MGHPPWAVTEATTLLPDNALWYIYIIRGMAARTQRETAVHAKERDPYKAGIGASTALVEKTASEGKTHEARSEIVAIEKFLLKN